MELTITKQELTRIIGATAKVVEARNTMPILTNVRLVATNDGGSEKLTVTATDLDIVITASGAATVTTPGAICVDAKLLGDIARKAGGDIHLSAEGDRLEVKSGRSRFVLQTLPAGDFPGLIQGEYAATFDIDLAALFDPVKFAISTEETRYYLNGVFFRSAAGQSVAVATDGHRLARHNGPDLPEFEGIIVPRKTVNNLPGGMASVSVSTQKIRIEAGDIIMISKLIDGTYPDYERVIPRGNDKVVTFASADMRAAAERVSVISSERGRAVKLSLADNTATLTVNSPDSGSATDEIVVGYDGEPLEVGFNSKYLAEIIGVFPAGEVTMALADGGSPALLTSASAPGLTTVLVPMRV